MYRNLKRSGIEKFTQKEKELKQVIIDLMANRHKLGAWQKYYQMELPKEHDQLDKWCLKSVQYLKLHDIQQRMRQNRQALQLVLIKR